MRYEVVEGWEQLPKGFEHRDVAGVAVDGEDRVFLICRGDHPVIAYDAKGSFLRSWGEGQFTYRTHGISVAPDGTLWATDDGNTPFASSRPRASCCERWARSTHPPTPGTTARTT